MMSKSKYTTIRLSKETKRMLDELKIHPRETYEQVVKRLIKSQKKNPVGTIPLR